jgi:hypothetical protein
MPEIAYALPVVRVSKIFNPNSSIWVYFYFLCFRKSFFFPPLTLAFAVAA